MVLMGSVLVISLALYHLEGRAFSWKAFVKLGNLKWGLLIGLGTLLNFMTSSLMFFAGQNPSLEKLGSVILW